MFRIRTADINDIVFYASYQCITCILEKTVFLLIFINVEFVLDP
jgi:hypothetical protein